MILLLMVDGNGVLHPRGMVVALACTSNLRIKLPTRLKLLVSRVLSSPSHSHSEASDNPLNGYPLNDNLKSRARDDGRSDMSDATETVKEGITNIIDTAEAIGESTKKAAEIVWESTKEGTDTFKEKLKDSGKAPPREDADADAAAMESGIDEEWKRRLH